MSGTVSNATTAVVAGTVTTAAQGNITSVGTLTTLTVSGTAAVGNLTTIGLMSATGTVTGSQFNGSGAGLTSIPGANVTGTLSIPTSSYAATVSTAAQPNITSVGTLSSLAVTGAITGASVSVTGNVTGANVVLTGLLLSTNTVSAAGNITGANLVASGVLISTNTISLAGTITAGTHAGSGSGLSSLPGANVTGTVPNATTAVVAGTVTTAAQGNITSVGTLTGLTINNATTAITNAAGNAIGNIGASGAFFNRLFAQATTALYADLAEMYATDAEYEPGTVLVFGGNQEVTISTETHDHRVAGVVSTNPAHIMNAGLQAEHTVEVALVGRVPVSVIGNITAGDRVVTSNRAGVAEALDITRYQPGVIIGKAVQGHTGDEVGVIEVVVGRL